MTKVYTVVGVVGDVRHTSLDSEFPCLYFSAATRLASVMDIVARTYGRPESALNSARGHPQYRSGAAGFECAHCGRLCL